MSGCWITFNLRINSIAKNDKSQKKNLKGQFQKDGSFFLRFFFFSYSKPNKSSTSLEVLTNIKKKKNEKNENKKITVTVTCITTKQTDKRHKQISIVHYK